MPRRHIAPHLYDKLPAYKEAMKLAGHPNVEDPKLQKEFQASRKDNELCKLHKKYGFASQYSFIERQINLLTADRRRLLFFTQLMSNTHGFPLKPKEERDAIIKQVREGGDEAAIAKAIGRSVHEVYAIVGPTKASMQNPKKKGPVPKNQTGDQKFQTAKTICRTKPPQAKKAKA